MTETKAVKKRVSQKHWNFAVCFEFQEDAPVTIRGVIPAGMPHLAASRAIKAAKKQRPRVRPNSYCILLQEATK